MTIKKELANWQKHNAFLIYEHPTHRKLYSLIKGDLTDDQQAAILDHLSRCQKCRNFLWEIEGFTKRENVLDVTFLKAAAAPKEASFSILSESGRYWILFRKLFDHKNRGVITLKIEPSFRNEMEGKKLVLTDSTGREILRGKVIKGETPGNIVDVNEIDWDTMIVSEDFS